MNFDADEPDDHPEPPAITVHLLSPAKPPKDRADALTAAGWTLTPDGRWLSPEGRTHTRAVALLLLQPLPPGGAMARRFLPKQRGRPKKTWKLEEADGGGGEGGG